MILSYFNIIFYGKQFGTFIEENEKIQRYMWEREARIKDGEDPRLVDKDIRIKIARVVKLSKEKLKPFEGIPLESTRN